MNNKQIIKTAVDTLSTILAFLIAYTMRNKGPLAGRLGTTQPIAVYLQVLPFTVLALIIIFSGFGLYKEEKEKSISETRNHLEAVFWWGIILMGGAYLAKYDYSRLILLFFVTVTYILTRLNRYALNLIFSHDAQKKEKTLLIGRGNLAERIEKELSKKQQTPQLTYLTRTEIEIVEQKIIELQPGEIIIADENLNQAEILNLIAHCKQRKVKFRVVTEIFPYLTKETAFLDTTKVNGSWWSGTPKRIFDLLVTPFIIFLSLPLLPFIFLSILIEDGPPIVIKQKRVGEGGKIFTMYKFRTMKKNAKKYADAPKTPADPRITKVGHFLRQSSLDELPQIINILKGDMSLVGPRPEMPQKVKRYEPWQEMRLEAKPGLTGLWQVLGRKDLPMEDNLEYDFYYIHNQSLWLDLAILLRTIPVVLSGKGAY